MFDNFFNIAWTYLPRLLRGAVITLRVTSFGVSIGFVIEIVSFLAARLSNSRGEIYRPFIY